ncbi:MAG: MraY family glycosyltransferase [Pseudomonadota bacterium]
MEILLAFVAAIFLTAVAIPPLIRYAPVLGMVDIPDKRKIHLGAVPRSGGLAVALGFLVTLFFFSPRPGPQIMAVVAGQIIILLFGIIDDRRGLAPWQKALGQTVAAAVTVTGGVGIETLGNIFGTGSVPLGPLAGPASVFFIVAATNSVNLTDGLDGLASGLGLLMFACIGLLAYSAGQVQIVVLSVCMAGAVLGFLRFNTYPATVFLGDTGSQLMGFSAGAVALMLTQPPSIYCRCLPLLILGLPLLDTLFVAVERLSQRISPFRPDRRHFHHKLMNMGLSHQEAVITIYVVQAVFTALAYLLRYSPDRHVLWGYTAFALAALIVVLVSTRRGVFARPAADGPLFLGTLRNVLLRTRIAQGARNLLCLCMALFFLVVPWLVTEYSPDIGLISLLFLAAMTAAWVRFQGTMRYVLRLSGYFMGGYLLASSELNAAAVVIGPYSWPVASLLNAHFALMALLFITYTIGTNERLSLTTLDGLVLVFALLVPMLPREMLTPYHLAPIVSKAIVFFVCFEPFAYRFRDRVALARIPVMFSLVVSAIRAWLTV